MAFNAKKGIQCKNTSQVSRWGQKLQANSCDLFRQGTFIAMWWDFHLCVTHFGSIDTAYIVIAVVSTL